MNTVYAHLYNEQFEPILSSIEINSMDKEYRTLSLGLNLTLFASNEQLEQIFDLIDSRLHPQTYTELLQALEIAENKISDLEMEIEELQQENCSTEISVHDGEYDFYEK